MRKRILVRMIIIVIVIAVALLSIEEQGIKLALDLQGGVMFVLRVQTMEAVKAETSQYSGYLKNELEDEGITDYAVTAGDDNIEVRIGAANPAHREALETIIDDKFEQFDYLDPKRRSGEYIYNLTWKEKHLKELKQATVRQVENSLRNRIDAIGVEEPNITTQRETTEETGERIIVQLPGLDDTQWAKEVLKRQAYLEWLPGVGEPAATKEGVLEQFGGKQPEGTLVLPQVEETESGEQKTVAWFCVKEEPIVTGGGLKYARLGQDGTGSPAVSFYLKANAADRFWEYTGAHKDERLVIVLDKKVISAPVIRAQISDTGIIEGNFTRKEADTLALLLRSGSLPAKPVFLHETRVGPTLGADSKEKGIRAVIIGLIFVMIFMLLYYKVAGLNSITALIMNIVLILGALAMLNAKLSLPGIAGLILTIGMAVDANVLIFERIREELDTGKTIRSAVNGGFGKALLTVLDANITTLIAAIFLFNFGTGPIKGFAIVLIIGIIASLFTAIFVSRTLFLLLFKIFPFAEKKEFSKALI